MKSSRPVTQGLFAQLVVSEGESVPITIRLRYESDDPYAVRVAFCPGGSNDTVEWIIGRDLLADGLKGPCGEGDVRLWPDNEHGFNDLYILLDPPEGFALVQAPAPEISRFLQRTESVVPTGTEPRHLDLDAVVVHLLTEG